MFRGSANGRCPTEVGHRGAARLRDDPLAAEGRLAGREAKRRRSERKPEEGGSWGKHGFPTSSAVCHTTRPSECLPRLHAMETQPTIVIVDDHPSFRRCARALLEADGFSVVGEAEDGEGALSVIGSLRPDVVLLDVQLPDMDGFKVLERLGEDAPPVVLVSSRDASDYNGLISTSGARGFISKAELSGSAVRLLLP